MGKHLKCDYTVQNLATVAKPYVTQNFASLERLASVLGMIYDADIVSCTPDQKQTLSRPICLRLFFYWNTWGGVQLQ